VSGSSDIFRREKAVWTAPRVPRRLQRAVLKLAPFLLLLTINGFVLFNAIVHPPAAAYDGGSHLANIRIMAGGHLPSPTNSDQFFSPPLPYALPALAYAAGLSWPVTAKLAQLSNVLLSMGTVYVVIRLARLIRPENERYTITALSILALMPVYYKSFTFIRGEPWVTFFTAVIAYEFLSLIVNKESGRRLTKRALRLGVWLGLIILSRQWGFLVWIAVTVFAAVMWRRPGATLTANRQTRRQAIRALLLASAAALVIGGWFYLSLQLRFANAAAFNRPLEASVSLSNHPSSFYSGLGNGKLFSDPVRPSFPNQLWPQFYAEFWGDYEAYFLVTGRDLRTNHVLAGYVLEDAVELNPPWLETNRAQMAAYLGRVNLIALGVTALMIAGLGYGFLAFWRWLTGEGRDIGTISSALLWLITTVSFAGYFLFVIMVPNPGNGDTIKATYLLHTYPLIALLTAGMLEVIHPRTRAGYGLLWAVIILTFIYLIPTFVTHYLPLWF
jgi:hypothetical protein